MTIIDAQVHIWGAETPERPWPPGAAVLAHRAVPLGKDELLREKDAAGVDRVVIVPPSWEGDRNDLAMEAALLHLDRFAIMGRIAIERPESHALVETWKQQPGMLGVRLTFHRNPQRAWLTDGTADWFWAAASPSGSAGRSKRARQSAPTPPYVRCMKGVTWNSNVHFHNRLHQNPNPTGMA